VRRTGVLGIVSMLALGACDPALKYVRTTHNAADPKPAKCAFDVLTVRPDRPFQELGVLEPDGPYTGSVAEYRNIARPFVCKAGGDAVVAEVNGLGMYIRGTVIRFTSAADATE
jgi:hypothetical protein